MKFKSIIFSFKIQGCVYMFVLTQDYLFFIFF